LAVTYKSYIILFSNHVGATLTNRAVSGSCLCDADSVTNSIYDRVTSYTDPADIIVVAGGTNDYNTGKPLGDYNSTDVKTVYGALRGMCEHIKTKYPDATVIFITPVNVTKDFPGAVLPLDAYRNAIYEIATLYKFNVVDGSTLGLPSESGTWGNDMIDDSDGCHPTELGHYQYFKGLCMKLL
jgi:lysophospholipase L1-like esterase